VAFIILYNENRIKYGNLGKEGGDALVEIRNLKNQDIKRK